MGRSDLQGRSAKRAGKACFRCRARKVRCVAVNNTPPCTNCIADRGECQFRAIRRTPRPPQNVLHIVAATTKNGVAGSFEPALRRYHHMPLVQHTDTWISLNSAMASIDESDMTTDHMLTLVNRLNKDIPNSDSKDATQASSPEASDEIGSNSSEVSGGVFDPTSLRYHNDDVSLLNLLSASPADNDPATVDVASNSSSSTVPNPVKKTQSHRSAPRPMFIKPLPVSLGLHDRHYLQQKGALSVPPTKLRDKILKRYIQHVHPYMPLLDLCTVQSCLGQSSHHDSTKIGILVFQAVMFAAVPYVDIRDLQQAGYVSHRVARKCFYDRARLLYEVDVEPDRLSVIQALVLMSLWIEAPGEARGGWHWLGVAISLAQSLGLHRQLDYRRLSPPEAHRRRRIWWACYIRDRVMALGMSRPMWIREGEYDTPMLTMADFELQLPEIPQCANLTEDLAFKDAVHLSEMGSLCIKMAELCTNVSTVINMHFSLLPSERSALNSKDLTGSTNPMLFRTDSSSVVDLETCDKLLQAWLTSLPHDCLYDEASTDSDFNGHNLRTLHATFLHLAFWSVVSALHRPFLHSALMQTDPSQAQLSRQRFQEAATWIKRINFDLHEQQLARGLLPATLTMELPAVVALIADLGSTPIDGVQEDLEALFHGLSILLALQEVYVGADLGINFVFDLLTRAGVVVIVGLLGKLERLEYGLYHHPRLPSSTVSEYSDSSAAGAQTPSSAVKDCDFLASPKFHNANASIGGGDQMMDIDPNEMWVADAFVRDIHLDLANDLDMLETSGRDWLALYDGIDTSTVGYGVEIV